MTDRKMEIRKQIIEAEAAEREAFSVASQTPEYRAFKQAQERCEGLYEEAGEEPYHYCESCRCPFFEGDEFFTFEDGGALCLMDGNPTGKVGPCYGKLAGIRQAGAGR